jgi:cytochrome c-type biogenesis protein CcsB
MHIRQGETENRMTSAQTYLQIEAQNSSVYEKSLIMSKISDNSYHDSFLVNGKNVVLTLKQYIPDAVYALEENKDGSAIAKMMVTSNRGSKRLELLHGDFFENDTFIIDFEVIEKTYSKNKKVVYLFLKDDKLMMKHSDEIQYLKMNDQSSGIFNASLSRDAEQRILYTVDDSSFVIREFMPHAIKKVISSTLEKSPMQMNKSGTDALVLEFDIENEKSEVVLFGRNGAIGETYSHTIAGETILLSYGAKIITLPFSLKLEKFDLDRYPGSNSPSSFASDVMLIDNEQNIHEKHRIFMNNVLEHRGFRFFQSSYDQDELGTILSVNNDPGTLPTYLGYLLLAIGMYGALFMKNGRFMILLKKAKEASAGQKVLSFIALFVASFLSITPIHADELNPLVKTILAFDKTHADKFGELVIQDSSGRMKPADTLNLEIVQKINRSNEILGLNPNQIILGMIVRPEAWREIKMIRTSHKEINTILGNSESEKYGAFTQFFEYPDEMSGYKLASAVNEAIRKAPGKRSKFDKAVLKVDERVNIAYMVYSGALLKIFPKPLDSGNKWFSIVEAMQTFELNEATDVRNLAVGYFTNIDKALSSGDWSEANKALADITVHQKNVGSAVYPAQMKLDLERFYNHANIFERLWPLYFLVGFILLFLSFAKIVNPKLKIDLATKVAFSLMVLFFIAHTVGLVVRWYISGHAPWSNGYESMVYIGWATLFSGYIFSKTSSITLASTGVLSGLILFVAHLNWMDPQVTNLVPVLQSYWLSIHVSMITASYGPLGLGALLGFITLILFIIKNEKNEKQISLSIKELNAINEMSLMIGLVMLTVGNFLGGVWANESWGRYWGWDPKETWALVTILVYAIVIHLRFIKALYSPFIYSVISLLAFTSVLMTYFGVNYYLAGLHSYAKGDPVPVPDFVPITYAIVFLIILLAARNRKLA